MTPSQDLYLNSEERFQLWQVKAAERPELLAVFSTSHQVDNVSDDEEKDGDCLIQQDQKHPGDPPPLTDGCDIPAWRQQALVDLKDDTIAEACLHIGSGCPLLRRESQLPIVSTLSRSTLAWRKLQTQLWQLNDNDTVCCRIPAASVANTAHPWFERDNVPVLLEGLADTWPAFTKPTMTWEALLQAYGDTEWRVSDTHAETLTLQTYTKYIHSLEGQTDDAPLALYDSQFHLDERASLVQDYTVPVCFAQDLYAVLDDDIDDVGDEAHGDTNVVDDVVVDDDDDDDDDDSDNVAANEASENERQQHTDDTIPRPPSRWILIGGARSGTGLHVDPVGTHAWVTLMEGCKRWVLFPPHVDRKVIDMQSPQIPSAIWFQKYYTTATTVYAKDAVHVVQKPGETVYVPAGWPHIVLNLEPSVALTENYATRYPNMDRFWKAVEAEEPLLGQALREKLVS